MIKFRRQGFARRQTAAQARQVIALACAFDLQHGVDHRRHAGEYRRTEFLNHLEHGLGGRTLGEQRRCAADGKRKEQIRPRRVAEKELRHRQRDVLRGDLQHLLGVALGVVGQVMLQVDGGLRLPGRA